MLLGAWQVLFGSVALAAVLAVVGVLLAATHWGWVHVAEYAGLIIDERQQRAVNQRRRDWLVAIQPYPRFSVSTSVLDDASTRVDRFLHRPVLTERHTFTFVRDVQDGQTCMTPTPPAEVYRDRRRDDAAPGAAWTP